MTQIPRVIHRIWLGGPPPSLYRDYDRRWREMYPKWRFCYWGNAAGAHAPLRNRASFDRAWRLDQKSDIMRYELLYQLGGVYVDFDFEPLRPMDEILEGVECFVCQWTGELLNNSCLGAAPGHPFIGQLIDRLPRSMSQHRPGRVTQQTGPHFLTRVLQGWRQRPDASARVTVFPAAYFHPFSPKECDRRWGKQDVPGAYAIHRWGSRRFGKQRVPSGRLPGQG